MTTAPTLTDGSVTLRLADEHRAEVVHDPEAWGGDAAARELTLRRLLDRAFGEQRLRTILWHVPVGDWASRRLAWRVGFSFDGLVRRWQPQRGDLNDAWVGTLLADDPREPRSTWLENPVLDGHGVRLRPFTEADVPRIVEGLGDADTQYWLSFMPRDPDAGHARTYLEKARERLATGHTIAWAFCTPDDDRLLGEMGLYRIAEEAELGYWTHPDARGRGLTTRAARLAIDHAFGTLGLDRLAAYASAPNAPSRRVLEATGFRPAGVRRRAARTGDGTVVDLAGYDLLAEERMPG